MKKITPTPADINAPWPFTTNTIKVVAGIDSRLSLHVVIGIRRYRLNGVAKTGAPLEIIWKKNKAPGFEGTRISISPIFKACRELIQ